MGSGVFSGHSQVSEELENKRKMRELGTEACRGGKGEGGVLFLEAWVKGWMLTLKIKKIV